MRTVNGVLKPSQPFVRSQITNIMMNNTFGFQIAPTRRIDMDTMSHDCFDRLLESVPSYRLCIGCGGCTATCSAGQFVDFDIRRVHTAFSRGRMEGLREQLDRCMLCGKCVLVCPRGVNTRALVINMRSLCEDQDGESPRIIGTVPTQFSIFNS